MTSFVLDNSITMRWFFDAGDHAEADAVLSTLIAGRSEAFVPVLWRYEVSAVLSRAQIKAAISSEETTRFINDLNLLPIRTDQESAGLILTDVHRLAVAYRLTTYDAANLEVALRRGLPIATLDGDLLAACTRAGIGSVFM